MGRAGRGSALPELRLGAIAPCAGCCAHAASAARGLCRLQRRSVQCARFVCSPASTQRGDAAGSGRKGGPRALLISAGKSCSIAVLGRTALIYPAVPIDSVLSQLSK